MPLRMSGLISGMDTESIVKELMKAQRLKTTKIENKITTLEWKQEKWKTLNTKIYGFYTGQLAKIRMQGSFDTKKASSSNEAKLEIQASNTAPQGTHRVKILSQASAQFVTGSILGKDINNKDITAATKLVDLGFDATEGTTITIEAGEKKATLDIGASTTVWDLTQACKKVGLNASYDTNQKRFFISSAESGNKNAFSITTSSTEYAQDRNIIRNYINYGAMSTEQKTAVDQALLAYIDPVLTEGDRDALKEDILTPAHTLVRNKFIEDYKKNPDNIAAVTASERERLEAELADGETLNEDVLKAAVNKKLAEDAVKAADEAYKSWEAGTADGTNVFQAAEDDLDGLLSNYLTDSGSEPTQTNSLSLLGISEITRTENEDGTYSVSADPHVVLIQPQDAKIIYNGAEIQSSSNVININGVTLTLKGVSDGLDNEVTTDDEVISLSISNDTEAVYDMIKDFVKGYNELLKEMNEAYNAETARGYDPLTDEERETMTDDQIEKWEDKIKTSLLRRDNTLSSIISSMRTAFSKSITLDGKSYSLTSFGIMSTNYTEKGLLHINGDSEDASVAAKQDELMKALNEDPEKVMEVFTQLSGDLYKTMTEQMRSTPLRSALTFYNDKEIKDTMDDYKEDLRLLEDKLLDIENRYYKQFAAMEAAMSKLNSQSSSLASMLGMSQ